MLVADRLVCLYLSMCSLAVIISLENTFGVGNERMGSCQGFV